MEQILLALGIGGMFGAALYVSGLADPDKIIGTLRLRDFHAMRTIAVFVLVGMGGTWILYMNGLAHFSIKPMTLLTVSIGGALLGVGFGMTGYCPGTGLACAAAGRFDALVTVVGMLIGALAFLGIYPYVVPRLEGMVVPGLEWIMELENPKITLPAFTDTNPGSWVIPIVLIGSAVLFLTRPRPRRTAEA